MDPDVDTHFATRLVSIEDLLDAIRDQPSFSAFHSEWMSFVDELNHAVDADVLSLETISKSHTLAHRVSEVVQTFLDLENLSKKLIASLTLEVSSILDEPEELSSPRATPPSESSPSSTMSSQDTGGHLPSYIKPAYDWLLAHLHNPYPSTDVRGHIAKETGSARKDIDGWFIDARKRVGWNKIRKEHFSNKRAGIVDAATRFFVEQDSTHPLDSNIQLELVTMEARAKDLYSENFAESDLAAKLDMVVKDMTPEMKAQAMAETRRRKLIELEEKEQQRIRAISSYPSPNPSPSHSPLPSANLYDDDLELTAFQSIRQSGRKRRNSSIELCNDNGHINRLTKRAKIDTLSHDDTSTLATGLPSPASSIHELLVPSDNVVLSSAMQGSSRKRRLSDADGEGVSKRPRNFHFPPRLQAVSDPMPFSSALLNASEFDCWFHENLGSIHNTELDSSTPLEVELYDVSTFDYQDQFTNLIQYPSPQIQDHKGLSPTTQLKDIQSFELDISINTFNCDDLFSPEDYPRASGAHNVSQPEQVLNIPYDLPSTLGLDFPPNFFNFYDVPAQSAHPIDRTLIADTSPISSNPEANLDWEFPPYTPASSSTANDSGHKFQDLLNTFSQDLITFNPSMIMSNIQPMEIPQSTNSPPRNQNLAQDDRAAKQQKLVEIKEAARRLEAELAATPC